MLRRAVLSIFVCLLAAAPSAALSMGSSTLRVPRPAHRRCAAPVAASKGKAKKKKAPASSGGGGGFGKAPADAATKQTPADRLKKSMEVYEQIVKTHVVETPASDDDDAADEAPPAEDVLVKYSITLRSTEATAPAEFADWVPVALVNLLCGVEADPGTIAPQVVGSLCREVYEAGAQAFPVLRKAPPQSIEYAYEPLDSFETHVYDGLLGRSERRGEAARTLGVELDASAGEIKKAHRKFMLELHPDRFAGDEEGAAAAQTRMLEVQAAYEQLGGGTGGSHGSWYASIGGKARVDFSGPLSKEQLGPLGKARVAQEMDLTLGGWRAGIYPMQPEITKEFVTRNIMRSKETQE